MINQEKVKDMTRMAVYEGHGGDKELAVCGYRRKDYVGLQLLKTFLLTTCSFVIILLLVLLVYDEILESLNSFYQAYRMVAVVGIAYLVFLAVFMVITYVWARRRYHSCEDRSVEYRQMLNRVGRSYQDSDSEV